MDKGNLVKTDSGSVGIEVGVRDGDWLVDVFDDLSGEDILKALRSVMLRSLA